MRGDQRLDRGRIRDDLVAWIDSQRFEAACSPRPSASPRGRVRHAQLPDRDAGAIDLMGTPAGTLQINHSCIARANEYTLNLCSLSGARLNAKLLRPRPILNGSPKRAADSVCVGPPVCR